MKKKIGTVIVLLIVIGIIVFVSLKFLNKKEVILPPTMMDLTGKNISEVNDYVKNNNLILKVSYEFDDNILKDSVISQSIIKDTVISKDQELSIVLSLGKLDKEKLKSDGINELGKVPIMMYHGIVNKKDSETPYTGGNVDKDGYNRTTESFRKDLEFYYNNGYRAIKLSDYVDGNIDVEYGYSPIIITFDDGNENNLKVTGLDESGNIIIDPNSAVGIMEEFKKQHPDFNTTAIFFVNGALFNQKEYNEKILNWLVDNDYEVGNHTYNHDNMANISTDTTQKTIATVYQKLDEIIPGKYVKIIALPFGTPYNKKHNNFPYILNGTYNGYTYTTNATLRVGWEPEVSSFDKNFDKTYMKRCRAYNNNGKEFDIDMVFKMLKNTRYISDGYKDIITVASDKVANVNDLGKRVITY